MIGKDFPDNNASFSILNRYLLWLYIAIFIAFKNSFSVYKPRAKKTATVTFLDESDENE